MDPEPAAWQLPSPKLSPRSLRQDVLVPPAPGAIPQPAGILLTPRILSSAEDAKPAASVQVLPADRFATDISVKDVNHASARTSTGRHMISDIVLFQAQVKAFEEMITCRIQADRGELYKLYNKADDLSAQLAHYKSMPSSLVSKSKHAVITEAKKEENLMKDVKLQSDNAKGFPNSKVLMCSQELRDAEDELGALDKDLTRALSPRTKHQRQALSLQTTEPPSPSLLDRSPASGFKSLPRPEFKVTAWLH